MDQETIARARRYAYHFFFRRMIPATVARATGKARWMSQLARYRDVEDKKGRPTEPATAEPQSEPEPAFGAGAHARGAPGDDGSHVGTTVGTVWRDVVKSTSFATV